jgi:hypothetical protein
MPTSVTENFKGGNTSVHKPTKYGALYPDDVAPAHRIPPSRGYIGDEIIASSSANGAEGTSSGTLGHSTTSPNDPNIHRLYIEKPHVSFTVLLGGVLSGGAGLPDTDMRIFSIWGGGGGAGTGTSSDKLFPSNDTWNDADPEGTGMSDIECNYWGHYFIYVRALNGIYLADQDNDYTITVTYNT